MQCTATADYITQNDQIKKKKISCLNTKSWSRERLYVYMHNKL